MPLPRLKNQCTAKAKHSQTRCKNPAAYDMKVCRNHGARKKHTILRGADHPQYKTGDYTKEAKQQISEQKLELKNLDDMMKRLGIIGNTEQRGRKPKGYKKLDLIKP